MRLLPPATGFTLITPSVPREELRRVIFWYKANHYAERHQLGSFVGHPLYDFKFKLKLERVRGLLSYRGVPWEESWYVLYEEEQRQARRLDNEQRQQRKLTKLNNAYAKAKENIRTSSELFKDVLYAELEEDYKRKYAEITRRYVTLE